MKTSEHGSAPSHNTKPNGWGIRIHPPPPQTKGCLQTEELRTRQLYLTKKNAIDGIWKGGESVWKGEGAELLALWSWFPRHEDERHHSWEAAHTLGSTGSHWATICASATFQSFWHYDERPRKWCGFVPTMRVSRAGANCSQEGRKGKRGCYYEGRTRRGGGERTDM